MARNTVAVADRPAVQATRQRPPFATLGLLYAVTAALGTVAFFTTFIFFLGNLPKASRPWLEPSADVGHAAVSPVLALCSNALLLILFSLQHSLMARPAVKRLVESLVPPPLERATYVHAANLAGFLVILLWQPVPLVLWRVENELFETVLWIGFAAGWLLLVAAALSIDILELLGIRQAWHWFRGQAPPPLRLKTSRLYGYLEHPMYVGVILGFWMTPYMTLGHAALAAQLSLYIALAVGYERRDLQARFGEDYDRWRAGRPVHGRPARIPAFARSIAAELSRHYQPVAAQPLPAEMRLLVARL
jgi:protein-S-isoprenylcysteine O-methyltransferase Ste14